MNIENAKNEFIKYTNNYDTENFHIARKIGHSLRVMEISKNIAIDLGLSNEEVEIATLIGLLHDIARFEQWRRYSTFRDVISVDHGDLGVEILKQENFIRNFIEEDKYDSLIYTAIKNHNKYKIEDGLNEQELLFSKIIRDADKLDIMYEGVEMFWQDKQEVEAIENSKITPNVYEEFMNKSTIEKRVRELPADGVICFIAFIFDINFAYNFKIIKKEDYINQILDKFKFKDEETKEKISEIRKVANEYIETRNKG